MIGKFLSNVIDLVDSSKSYISTDKWLKIIKHADKETLIYLQEEGMSSWKYFTRSDWLGPENVDRIREAMMQRAMELHDSEIHQWFIEAFKEAFLP